MRPDPDFNLLKSLPRNIKIIYALVKTLLVFNDRNRDSIGNCLRQWERSGNDAVLGGKLYSKDFNNLLKSLLIKFSCKQKRLSLKYHAC